MLPLTIFYDTDLPEAAERLLREGIGSHRLVHPETRQRSNLAERAAAPELLAADIAFGQPPASAIIAAPKLRWVHLTTAGYTRYDMPEVRGALEARGAVLTNSSAVYADPCAEHCLAMMLSIARRLPDSLDDQRGARAFEGALRRERSALLRGQAVLLLGYGAIGRRLAELLAPFEVRLTALRRSNAGDGRAEIIDASGLDRALSEADHVVSVLPEGEGTRGLMNTARFAQMRAGAFFYNVGRGATVDEAALVEALARGAIGGAYLDVTAVEPLPPSHPLWSLPNCFITPHSAGGQQEEPAALVRHFLGNLRRFERGEALQDRVFG